MSLETAALDHICNVIRRQIQEEIRDLTLFFIIHKPGERMKALEANRLELLEHPGGGALLPILKQEAAAMPEISGFVGLNVEETTRFFSLLKQRRILAALFVNSEDFKTEEETRQGIYHLTWHALSLLQHYENKEEEYYTLDQGIVRPIDNPVILSRENMLGDAFSAILLELQGEKDTIHKLAKKRCMMAMQAIKGFQAEQYPYPIAADATKMVFDELMEDAGNKTKIIRRAMETTREIGYTYDDTSIKQWATFSAAAQEMAWLGLDKSRILSTAIYTSEDPYVRSTAYIVAEALKMEPAPLANLNIFNPFADQEVNERLHNKRCDEAFQTLISKTAGGKNENLFSDKARMQNTKLMKGDAIGWCAHALLSAATAEEATAAYHEARKKLSWETLNIFSTMIINHRRQGMDINPGLIARLCKEHTAFGDLAKAFEQAAPLDVPLEEEPKEVPAPIEEKPQEPEEIKLEIADD